MKCDLSSTFSRMMRKALRTGEFDPAHKEAEKFFVQRIKEAELSSVPFDNIVIKDALPADYYEKILKLFPALEIFIPYHYPGAVQPDGSTARYMLMLNDCCAHLEGHGLHGSVERIPLSSRYFWTGVMNLFNSKPVYNALMEKFRRNIEQKFGNPIEVLDFDCETTLTVDTTGYMIPPHPDGKIKVVSAIYFVAPDDSLAHLSTEYYKEDANGTVTNPAGKTFSKVVEVPYIPNIFQAFAPTESSWHGVSYIKDVGIERNGLHLLIREKAA